MLRAFYIFFLAGVLAENSSENGTYYESLTGQIITWEEFKKHVEDNTTYWCTGNLTACDANEGRRQDGSCNNLKHPTRGTPHTPYYTELPLVFEHGNEPVRLKTGEQLDARKVRMETLPEGIIPDQKFSILLVHYLLFGFGNIGSLHDTVNYVLWRPYCCAEKGKSDPMCYPIKIRSDDQVHQFSGIRCYNNTRPITFQTEGCIRDKKSTPQRLNSATNFFDLPTIYAGGKAVRTMEDGMLRVEEENGKIWPMSMPEEMVDGICLLNEKPKETRCHIVGPANSLFGINFLSIIFWRYHNFIAERLKRVNPCWSDEEIFETAKEINIAQFTQIYFYEMLPLMLGRGNLYREGIISYYEDHRDPYDENLIPQQSIEYHYALRWTHTIQPGHLEMFDGSGNYLRQIPVTNVSFRTGYFPLDNHFEGFTQACFRQAAAKFDNVVDPVISQSGITGVQRAFDITAADLMKGGLFGIQPYIYYREMCTGMRYSKWEDLIRDMEPEYIEMLKKQFKYVQDIPLMAGMWLERKIPGGEVPLTFACINFRQLKRFVQHDRHWYERPNRPNAFSRQQLRQIRRSNIARILCDVGDTITHITPQAFLRESGRNRITSCSNIATIDYRAWRDSSC